MLEEATPTLRAETLHDLAASLLAVTTDLVRIAERLHAQYDALERAAYEEEDLAHDAHPV